MLSKVEIVLEEKGLGSTDQGLGKEAKSNVVSMNAHRAVFSAKRFFEVTDVDEIKLFCALVVKKIVALEIDLVIVDPKIENYFDFPSEINYCNDYSIQGNIEQSVCVLYLDAVDGLPVLGFYKESGTTAYTWSDLVSELIPKIPKHAWTVTEKNIYPIDIPRPNFHRNLDMILIDCPSRNLSMMPNGLGYVSNAIKNTGVTFQVYDLDIVSYHRFHMDRLYNQGGKQFLGSGKLLPKDPWQAEHYDVWSEKEMSDFIFPFISDIIDQIVDAKPKILGMSIQSCNVAVSTLVAKIIKARSPETLIIVGGFSCYNADIGLKAFPLADYMCIGEADLTVGELVKQLSKGKVVKDMAGVLSKLDTPDRIYVPAPMENNLDKLKDPRYEWFPLSIYRNWDGYQLTPIIASRGCKWSRCTFCAERFYWRIRDPKQFVDEIEYLVSQGCHLFMFNESDLNGDPKIVMDICDEIVKRQLKVKLTAQLRIHKKSDRMFFEKLAAAGFVALRFGVDAFSYNTLRLQKKGYTKDTIRQNLRDCHECGIYTEVNWVIGVPGETDADCAEGVEFILENQQYIGRVANINPLILVNGSVYWIDPESHNIKFYGDSKEIFEKNDRYVPSNLWYSEEPFINAATRKSRFETIVVSLIDGGFALGPWAEKIYQTVKHNKSREHRQDKKTLVTTQA